MGPGQNQKGQQKTVEVGGFNPVFKAPWKTANHNCVSPGADETMWLGVSRVPGGQGCSRAQDRHPRQEEEPGQRPGGGLAMTVAGLGAPKGPQGTGTDPSLRSRTAARAPSSGHSHPGLPAQNPLWGEGKALQAPRERTCWESDTSPHLLGGPGAVAPPLWACPLTCA